MKQNKSEFEQIIKLKVFDNEYKEKLERLDFIKIDVEGAELFALKGMYFHIEKYKPLLLIEINEDTFNAAGYTSKELVDYLSDFGYEPYSIFRGRLKKIEKSNVFSSWGNYIFKCAL